MAKNAVIRVATAGNVIEEIYPITKVENILNLSTDDPAIPISDINGLFTGTPSVENQLTIDDFYTKSEIDGMLEGISSIKLKKW